MRWSNLFSGEDMPGQFDHSKVPSPQRLVQVVQPGDLPIAMPLQAGHGCQWIADGWRRRVAIALAWWFQLTPSPSWAGVQTGIRSWQRVSGGVKSSRHIAKTSGRSHLVGPDLMSERGRGRQGGMEGEEEESVFTRACRQRNT